MAQPLLQVNNLHVSVEGKEILHGLNLTIHEGEVHVLMGPNGAGKSTLGNALMGHPSYTVTKGQILFKGEDITEISVDKRAKAGLYLSFQNPVEVPGVTVSDFLRTAKAEVSGERVFLMRFKKSLGEKMKELNMDSVYAERDLNVGFSGGEKKKTEILQLLTLNPSLAILDETDSGLDVDAVKTVSKGVSLFMGQEEKKALLIITHSTRILDELKVDYTHVLLNGQIVETGDASLVEEINTSGFERFLAGR